MYFYLSFLIIEMSDGSMDRRSSMKQYLLNCMSKLGMEITEDQLLQFETFYHLLMEKNKVMNLTAITKMEEVVEKHFIDSIAVLKFIMLDDKSVIDVGTGAGFPGIPLAIMSPNTSFLLLDSLNKRIKFLEEVVHQCDLSNVSLIHCRAEDGGKEKSLRENYDVCISRAVANMSVLLEYCSPFVKQGGQFISYKSGDILEELESSERAQKILSCKLNQCIQFELMGDMNRSFVIFDKIEMLSKKYPRQPGKVKKDPL